MSTIPNPLANFDQIATNGFTTPSFATADLGSTSGLETFGSQAEVLGLASNPFTSAAAIPVAIVTSGATQAQAATTAANTEATGINAAAQNAVSGFFLGLISTRVIAIILGLIFIAGAFLLFVGDDISDGLKKAAPILTGA